MKINISSLWEKIGIEDDIGLIQQLFDAYYGEELNTGKIILIKNSDSKVVNYIRQNPNVCGVRNLDTIKYCEKYKAISPVDSDRRRFPCFDNKLEADVYEILISWNDLKKYAGSLHDIEAEEPLGRAEQKRFVKEALQKVDSQSEIERIVVTERILGSYSDHVSIAQEIRDDGSPDRHIQFITTLRELQKDGFLTIYDIEFNFAAFPTPIDEEQQRLAEGVFIDADALFYPAEHCRVTLELARSNYTASSFHTGETVYRMVRGGG